MFEVSGGDLRKSINMLQSASTLYEKRVTVDLVFEISGVTNPNINKLDIARLLYRWYRILIKREES